MSSAFFAEHATLPLQVPNKVLSFHVPLTNMDDSYSATADKLRATIQEKVDQVKSDPAMAEIIKLQTALNGLEAVLGRPATSLAQFFSLDAGSIGKAIFLPTTMSCVEVIESTEDKFALWNRITSSTT